MPRPIETIKIHTTLVRLPSYLWEELVKRSLQFKKYNTSYSANKIMVLAIEHWLKEFKAGKVELE